MQSNGWFVRVLSKPSVSPVCCSARLKCPGAPHPHVGRPSSGKPPRLARAPSPCRLVAVTPAPPLSPYPSPPLETPPAAFQRFPAAPGCTRFVREDQTTPTAQHACAATPRTPESAQPGISYGVSNTRPRQLAQARQAPDAQFFRGLPGGPAGAIQILTTAGAVPRTIAADFPFGKIAFW